MTVFGEYSSVVSLRCSVSERRGFGRVALVAKGCWEEIMLKGVD